MQMPMDDRKQRVLRAIVSLYSDDGEPVGSGLLADVYKRQYQYNKKWAKTQFTGRLQRKNFAEKHTGES